jgi:hypothetical protein
VTRPRGVLRALGMPIMIVKRVADPTLKSAVANGTIGHIVGHELSSDSFLQRTVEDISILRHRTLLKWILIRIQNCDRQIQDGYPLGFLRCLRCTTGSLPAFPGRVKFSYRAKGKLAILQ